MEIKIDSEFEKYIPPLKDEEFRQLEENILSEGCREPLIIWSETGLLLDGHNRYRICTKHNIEFKSSWKSLPNRESALDWIDTNQLGRRNLSPDDFKLILGRRYNRMKKAASGNSGGKNQYSELDGQNDHQAKTAEILAQQHNVGEKTVRRAGQYAEAVDIIKTIEEDFDHKTMSNKQVKEVAALAKTDKKKAKEMIENHKKPKEQKTGKGGRKPLIDMNAGNEIDVMAAMNHQFATIAISQLQRIRVDDEYSFEAVLRVKKAISEIIKSIKEYQNKTRKSINE